MQSSAAETPYERRFLRLALFAPAASLALAGIILFPPQGLALAVAIGICWLASARGSDLVFFLLLETVSTLLVLLGVIRFTYFPQAVYLLRRNADPLAMTLDFQLWGPRYLLSYPAVLLSRWFDLHLDLAFTLYGLFCMAILALVLIRCCDLAGFFDVFPDQRYLCQFLVGSIWLCIASFMNGRLMNAFLGMTLVLAGQVLAVQRKKLTAAATLLQAVGVFLTLMTTGTVMVAFAQMLVGGLLIHNFHPLQDRFRRTRSAAIFILSAVLLLPFLYEGTVKNVAFFEGSATGLLGHGAGSLFLMDPMITLSLLVLVLLVAGALAVVRYSWVRRNPALWPAWLAVPIALVGGLFGYSTLLMGLPSLMMLGLYALVRFLGRLPVAPVSQAMQVR